MRRIYKPIIAFSILVAFGLSVILCCCAMQLPHTSSVKNMKTMTSDPCQKDSSSKKTSHHGYCFLNAPLAEKVQSSAFVIPSFHSVYHVQEVVVDFEQYVHQFAFVRTAYGGMRLSQTQPVPIYLHIRNLRL